MRYINRKLAYSVILATALALPSAPAAAAFDPTGFLVNKLMEYIIDQATKPAKPETPDYPISNRTIPKDSKEGTLEPPRNGNQLEIDGDDYTLAFNSRIRDEGNRIVHTGNIQQEKRIRYTLNNQQQVNKIWLLAPGEK